MKKYMVYKILPAFLLAVALSSCGSEAANRGQNYSNQMLEVTKPANNDGNLPQGDYRALPRENSSSVGMESNTELANTRNVGKDVYLGGLNIGGMSETELTKRLEQIAAKTDVAVMEAQYNAETWTIKKEKAGIKLDIDKIIETALSADAGKKIKYSYVNVDPKITAAQLTGKVKLIAKFTTPLLDRSKSRVKNIRLAAKKIDRKIILPGEEFSFNRTTGHRSKELGYEDATVIVNTPDGPKHEKAPGGGVCQLSTTIYNAVLKCGLKVTERHEHSDVVHYVPDGKDATVSYNGADLKFINNRNNPIMLRVYVGKKTVNVKIMENSGLNVI